MVVTGARRASSGGGYRDLGSVCHAKMTIAMRAMSVEMSVEMSAGAMRTARLGAVAAGIPEASSEGISEAISEGISEACRRLGSVGSLPSST